MKIVPPVFYITRYSRYWDESSNAEFGSATHSRSSVINKYCCASIKKSNKQTKKQSEIEIISSLPFSICLICFTCEKKTMNDIEISGTLILAKWYNPKLGQSFSMIKQLLNSNIRKIMYAQTIQSRNKITRNCSLPT